MFFPTLQNSKFRLLKITQMKRFLKHYTKNYTINIRREKKINTFLLYFEQQKPLKEKVNQKSRSHLQLCNCP